MAYPKRTRTNGVAAARRTVQDRIATRPSVGSPIGCVSSEPCPNPALAHSPVPLCGKHIREVYEFASDYLTERWDDAVREYVADLHQTFRPPRAVKAPKPGNVYFIRLGDRVKIGYSTNPEARFKVLPHEQIIGVIPGTREDEAAWHELLAKHRVVGEWFAATPEVLETLMRVAVSKAS